MKALPIPFTGEMVRAILAGRKTQTRRLIVADRHSLDALAHYDGWTWNGGIDGVGGASIPLHGGTFSIPLRCHYGGVGRRLYVKEAITCITTNVKVGDPARAVYEADGSPAPLDTWPWKVWKLPGMYMPYRLRRIELEVTDVRLERPRSISEADAMAEGVERDMSPSDDPTYKSAFAVLWERINGKRQPWASNRPVWVLTFKRVEM